MSQQETAIQHKGQEALIVLLKEAQSQSGYVSQEVMAELARSLNIPINDVYGVATFYSFLSVKPLGRNVIRVCKSSPCYIKDYLVKSVEQEIGIKPGETTADGRFSLQLTNCIGACDQASAMMINQDVHGDLTPEKISRILGEYK